MARSSDTFSRIISPVSAGEFFDDYWEKKPLFISRDAPGFYDDALTAADIDGYFQNQHISPGFLNVMKDGESCPPEQWTFTAQKLRDSFSQRLVDVKKLLNLFNEGATIILNSGETAMPSLTGLRRALENELKCRVQANIYITPPQKQGFPPHFDAHNVLILQIHGSKRWNLYDSPVANPVKVTPVKPKDYQDREPVQSVEMKPGDLLYIPRGMVHYARSEEHYSIHVTVGPMLRHWSTLLKLLVKEADNDETFRRLLPHGLSSENERADFAAEFTERLQELIGRVDFPAMQYSSFIEEQRADPRGRFTDILQINRLTPDSMVCRRTSLDYLVEKTDQWITVRFEEEELVLPVFLETALDKIFGEKPFTVREIQGIPNEAGKLALVKRFVQTGFLTVISI